jgi:hypothetical protein
MPYPELKNAIQRAGFTITEFSDQKAFFGYWSLTVEGYRHFYLIVNEGREGWMMFYIKDTDGPLLSWIKKNRPGWTTLTGRPNPLSGFPAPAHRG